VRLQNDEIHVLDAANGRPRFRLQGRPFIFKAWRLWGYGVDMAFSPDGEVFAATRQEGGVSLHATADGRETGVWAAKEGIVAVAFAHHGRWLAAGGGRTPEENVVAILDGATGRELRRAALPGRADFLTWSADDRWLCVGTRPVQVRAAEDLALRAVVPDRAALHGRFLADNQRLLVSEQTGQTRLWDIDTGRLLLTKQDGGRPGVWFDGEPPRQWRYFSDGKVELHAFKDREVFQAIPSPVANQTVPSLVDPVDVSADGRWLLVGGWSGPTLIDLRANRVVGRRATGPASVPAVGRFEPGGAAIWVGRGTGPLYRHPFSVGADGRPEMGDGEEVAGHDGFMPTAAHAGTARLALTDYRGGRVRLLALPAREVVAEWALPRASHVAFSPDGRLVLSNGEPAEGGRAEVREAATGRLVRALGDQSGRVAVWSPDGRWVLAGTARDRVGLWRADTWEPGPALPADLQFFSNLAAISPDGRLLAVRGNQAIALFRTETAEPLAQLAVEDSLRSVPAVRFTTDGRRLIVVRMEGRIDLWDLESLRRELRELGLDWEK
jgi:WD40 repeat protein